MSVLDAVVNYGFYDFHIIIPFMLLYCDDSRILHKR